MRNKSVLVTGAGRGIGRAIAIEFAKNGYDVGINYYHSKQLAQEVEEEIKSLGQEAICIQGDVGNCKDIERMVETFVNEFGKIDVLINNAGISEFIPLVDVTEEFFEKIISTDFKGAVFATKATAKNMIKNKIHGSIVNISSNHTGACWPNASIYASGKAALNQFTKNAAMELAKYNIRVNSVAPGYTDVGWTQFPGIYEAQKRIPMQRFANPKEMAKLVCFIASDENSYMTGSSIVSDGGALLPAIPENEYME